MGIPLAHVKFLQAAFVMGPSGRGQTVPETAKTDRSYPLRRLNSGVITLRGGDFWTPHGFETLISEPSSQRVSKGYPFNRKGNPQFVPIAEVGQIPLEDARLKALAILQSIRDTGMTPKQHKAVEDQDRQKEERLNITLGETLEEYISVRKKPGRRRSIKTATGENMRREVKKYLD